MAGNSAWKIRGSLTGVKSTVDSLYWLNTLMRGRVLKSAMTRAARIVSIAAKKNIKAQNLVLTGQLLKSIGTKVKVYQNGNVVVVIGPRVGFKIMVARGFNTKHGPPSPGTKMIPVDPVRYAHLLEGGTRPHALGKGSKLPRLGPNGQIIRPGTFQRGAMHPGFSPKPFLRPAWDNNKAAIEASIIQDIRLGVSRATAGKQTARPSKRNP